jgi:5-methylcytosine-specific restriction endonuclease McrA
MTRILALQRKVLAFACDARTRVPLNNLTVFTNEFGAETGKWLWDRLTTTKRGKGTVSSSFHNALVALINHTSKHPATRSAILNAFDHDTKFDARSSDPTFQFAYKVIDKKTQKVVHQLMNVFYKDLLKNGFPSCVHGSTGKFDRDALVNAFWDANKEMRLCPACDDKRSDSVGKKIYSDADHFFPQSKYPFLCLHLANLLPTCTDCNRKFKLSNDPVDDHTLEPLLNTFLPYSNPAVEHIEVRISRTAGGELKLRVKDSGGTSSRRVKSLNRVLKLEQRWEGRLVDSKSFMIEDLKSQERLQKRLKAIPRNSVSNRMKQVLKTKESSIGKRQSGYLDTQYLKYAIKDVDEIDFLYAEASRP